MNRIGIVTVTYNSAKVIDGFLDSLLAQTYANFVLYVIDNASGDDTLALVACHQDPRISVTRNAVNVGFAEGSNQGIRAALDEYCNAVLLMNNDTEFGPQLLQTLVNGLGEDQVDMVAPKILFYDNPDVIWSAGGGWNRARGYSGFHYGYGLRNRGDFDIVRFVDHAPACCLLARRGVFEQIGMLDENYFVYTEDTDFCYRAKQAGLKVLYLPSATVLHKASSLTGGPKSAFTTRYLTRNKVYFLLKHVGLWRTLYYMFAYEVSLVLKFLTGKSTVSEYRMRQKALLEGLILWKHTRSELKSSANLSSGTAVGP